MAEPFSDPGSALRLLGGPCASSPGRSPRQDQPTADVDELDDNPFGVDYDPDDAVLDDQAETQHTGAAAPEGRLRRQGLPCRMLVDRQGDRFVHVARNEDQTRDLARVIGLRRSKIRAYEDPACSHAPPGEDPMVVTCPKRTVKALTREAQADIWKSFEYQWCVKHAATWLEGKTSDDMTHWNLFVKKKLRVYNFTFFGGEIWLKFLIALGDVGPEAVEAVNTVIDGRIHDLTGRRATNLPTAPCDRLHRDPSADQPSDMRYWSRAERDSCASSPGKALKPRKRKADAKSALRLLDKKEAKCMRRKGFLTKFEKEYLNKGREEQMEVVRLAERDQKDIRRQ